jgi:hypothetical protein
MANGLLQQAVSIAGTPVRTDTSTIQRNISEAIGMFQKNKERNMMLQLAQQKRQQDMQDAIRLATAKAQIEQRFKEPPSAADQLIELSKVAEARQSLGVPAGQGGIDQALATIGVRGSQPVATGQAPSVSPQIAPSGQPDVRATTFEQTPFGGLRPTKFEDVGLIGEKEQKKKAIGSSAKLTDDFIKNNRNLLRTEALFSELVANLKGKKEEQGGLGIVPGIKGRLGQFGQSLFGDRPGQEGFGRTAAFKGQLEETAIGLSPILTGQNRIIKSIVEMISKTLPTELDSESIAANKIRQSLTNAIKLNLSFERGLLSPDEIERLQGVDDKFDLEKRLNTVVKLSTDEQKFLDQRVNDVLNTPKSRPLGGLGGLPQQGQPQGLQQQPQAGVSDELSAINAELAEINRQLGGQ